MTSDRPPVVIPMPPPGPNWRPRLLEDLRKLKVLERVGAGRFWLCIFCRSPVVPEEVYQRFEPDALRRDGTRDLELPDGIWLTLVPRPPTGPVCCTDCLRTITGCMLEPDHLVFATCDRCDCYILVPSVEVARARTIRRTRVKLATWDSPEVSFPELSSLCLACQLSLTKGAAFWPYRTPLMCAGYDASGRQGLHDYYLFTEPPEAFSVVYEPAAVVSAL